MKSCWTRGLASSWLIALVAGWRSAPASVPAIDLAPSGRRFSIAAATSTLSYSWLTRKIESAFRTSGSAITSALASLQALLSSTWRLTQSVEIPTTAISDATRMSVQIENRRHRPSLGGAAEVVR